MKRIASYCLFGNHVQHGTRQFYWDCLPAVVRAHHNLFSGWELRIHHDSTVKEAHSAKLRAYAAAGLVSLRYVEENTAVCRSMLWRMLPIWEPETEYVICRDMDSLPILKDRKAVEMFVHSGAAAHTINDHPQHTEPMMGGMIGFHAPRFLAITKLKSWDELVALNADLAVPHGGHDQILMHHNIWHRLYPSICAHRFAGMSVDRGLLACYSQVWDKNPSDVQESLLDKSDQLMPFLGAPGFDVPRAIEVLDRYGNPEIAARIKAVEQCAG